MNMNGWRKACRVLVVLVAVGLAVLVVIRKMGKQPDETDKSSVLAEEPAVWQSVEGVASETGRTVNTEQSEGAISDETPRFESENQAIYVGTIRYTQYAWKEAYTQLSQYTETKKNVLKGEDSVSISNEKGENLSNTLIEKEIYAPAGREMWQRMEQSHWLLDGKKDAPVIVYVFADPFCPYCKQFWQQARPWVDSGKVQLRTLLVGVIKPESPATAAAILASKDPAKTWQEYEASGGKLKLNVPANVSTEQMKVLSDNEKLMDDLGANVTPAIYYMSKENTLQQAVGFPDQKTLNIIMGNK